MPLEFKTGSFTKSTGAAPASQAVTGVGFQPKALILWSVAGLTDNTFRASYFSGIGFAAGTAAADRGSVGASNEDATVGASNVAGRHAEKVLVFSNLAGNGAFAECDLTSFDSDGFTLNWTTNDANAYIIHYLALGGTDLTNAKVLRWNTPTATGNHAVTGVGFKPDAVMLIGAGSAANPPSSFTTHSPTLSAFDGSGGQWALGHRSNDNAAMTQENRVKDASLAFLVPSGTGVAAIDAEATWVSMDTDGFTLNFSDAPAAAFRIYALCLKGPRFKAGSFTKSTGGAPASQSVTGVGFTPRGLAFASDMDVVATDNRAHNRWGLGFYDGTNEQAGTRVAENNVAVSNVDAISRSDKVFVKVDNTTATQDAVADGTSLDADGFTLNWTTNDAVATQIFYLAAGDAPTGGNTNQLMLMGSGT